MDVQTPRVQECGSAGVPRAANSTRGATTWAAAHNCWHTLFTCVSVVNVPAVEVWGLRVEVIGTYLPSWRPLLIS